MPSPFDRLMDTVRPHLPGAIDRAIKQELFLLCNDFFKNSNTWREDLPFIVYAGQSTAGVTPSAGKVAQLLYVKNTDDMYVSGIYMTSPGTIETRIAPVEDTSYTGTFAMTVVDPTDADAFPLVPSDLVERYTEELVHGIIARMMMQPSKPYSDPGKAQWHLVKYRGSMARARNEMNEGFTRGSQRWAFPQSFRV